MANKIYVKVSGSVDPIEDNPIKLFDKWLMNNKIENTGSILGRAFIIDYLIEDGTLSIFTGGKTLKRFRKALQKGKKLDMVFIGNSCKQKYSSINISVLIGKIELDTKTTIINIEPIIIKPDNTKIKLPKINTYKITLLPISWIFDEFVGTTANDYKIKTGNINIQYRIEYKKGKIDTKYVAFSCDDRYKPYIFLYGCPL